MRNSSVAARTYVRVPAVVAAMLALIAAVLLAPSAHSVEVPIESCESPGYGCSSTLPVYNGPGPANWETAIQLSCSRFAAAHRGSGFCPCDGTICSEVTACDVVSTVPGPTTIGVNLLISTMDLEAFIPAIGANVDYGQRASAQCKCPLNAGFNVEGRCACSGSLQWNGTACVTCTGDNYLDTCALPTIQDKNATNCTVSGTNPCDPGAGIKVQRESVFSDRLLGIELIYVSKRVGSSVLPKPTPFGTGWTFSFGRQLITSFSGGKIGGARADGRVLQYLPPASGDVYVGDADIADRLEIARDAGGANVGWNYHEAKTDAIERYDAAGKLVRIDFLGGQFVEFTYSTAATPIAIARKADLLIQAADKYGRTLQFFYDQAHRVARMVDVAGQDYFFAYDENTAIVTTTAVTGNNLTSITFPDGHTRRYHFNEPANTSGASLLTSLTGITDENASRFSTYKYDTQGRPISTEHAGGAQLTTFSYNADGSALVTDSLGTSRTYGYSPILGVAKNTGITGPVCPRCGPAAQSFDGNGNVSSRTDWNGNRTNFTYDLARNLEASRTEGLTSTGATTTQTRTINTQWDATFRLPAAIAEPLKITSNTFDADGTQCGARGTLCSRTVQATTDANGSLGFSATPTGSPRTWAYTYNANGSVLTMNGPRTDVSDITSYTYYADDDADLGKRGNVATVTNATGHVTSITAYNAHGQPLTIVDPNGLTTTLAYDARQRLTSRTVGSETTSYEYDGVGQLTKVTLPDGSFLTYSYDAAHRMSGMQDNLGNRIAYTLDTMGNRTQEEVFDSGNALAQTRARVFDNLNRLFQEIGAASQVTEFAYDDQGNVTSVKDPLNRTTANAYDELNRLRQVTDPDLGVTQYAYDGLDALTQVTDPRGLATGYVVDGLGNLTLQQSRDTGNTVNSYDAAGNLLAQTDAKGQTTAYAYDALNRVTLITFHDGSKQTYGYDSGANGLGRLATITETDPANQVTNLLAFGYDPHGRVTSETRTLAGVPYVLAYSYDAAGRVSGMTYPSGRTVSYDFDALGRVNHVSTTKPRDSPQVVVENVAYHAFGGVTGFTFGNGQTYSRAVDQDGRIASYSLGAQNYAIGYDAASRIAFISDFADPANSNTYGYDALDRLTSAVLPFSNYAYAYDAVGNRISKTVGASTDTYAYASTSNRIASITPASGPLQSFTFDPNGSTLGDSTNTYAYDTRGRMVQAVSSLGTTSYQVNALGQRVRKTNVSGDTVFHYDTRGRLIAETDPGGTVKRELIYLGDMPVGAVQ